jgi:hypothetical protein
VSAVIESIFEKVCIEIPLFAFLQKRIGMDHRAANPLANEVSRAFVPPCTRRDVSPTGGSSRTSTLFEAPEP